MNAVGTMGRSESHAGALDRAALAVGSALVSWSARHTARASAPVDVERVMIRRAAEMEAQHVLAERHAGSNYSLYRMS